VRAVSWQVPTSGLVVTVRADPHGERAEWAHVNGRAWFNGAGYAGIDIPAYSYIIVATNGLPFKDFLNDLIAKHRMYRQG
jgi:hypothetical protein